MALTPIGLLAAFGAGVLSFLAPCVVPLVPGYLSFLAGTSLAVSRGDPGPARCQCRTLDRAPAGEPTCALVRRRLHPGADAAGRRSRGTGQCLERVSAGAGAHRRSLAYSVWHCAHRPGASGVALLGSPRQREIRSVGLVALG